MRGENKKGKQKKQKCKKIRDWRVYLCARSVLDLEDLGTKSTPVSPYESPCGAGWLLKKNFVYS